MISELHLLDEHAPFPHYVVTIDETVTVRDAGNARNRIQEHRAFTFVICATCGHNVAGDRAKCNCRASCHGTMVPSDQST